MRRIIAILATFILIFFCAVSCQKDIENETVAPLPTKESAIADTLGNQVTLRAAVPLTTVYEISPSILSYFQHYCQLNAPRPIDGTKACGPTSLMMANACIAKYVNPQTTYSASGTKLASIISVTQVSTYLTDLSAYVRNHDNSFASVSEQFTSNRETMKTFIQNSLKAGKFVIVAVNMFGSGTRVNNSKLYSSNTSPDMDATQETSTNYITTKYGVYQSCRNVTKMSGVFGHIMILIKLTVYADGSGFAEYIDPIASTRSGGLSNRRYVSYTRLLNSMSINGCSNNYDAIAIGKK